MKWQSVLLYQKLTLVLAVSDRLSLLAESSFCAERFSWNKNSVCQKQKVAPQERVTKKKKSVEECVKISIKLLHYSIWAHCHTYLAVLHLFCYF